MIAQISPYDEEQIRSLATNYKLTPATLAHRLNPHWVSSPHLLYISTEVATAIARGNSRLVISVPPRHGKSELITKYTTTWVLEHFPKLQVALASYGSELSTDFGRKVRDIINDNQHLLNVRLRKDSGSAHNWLTDEGGGMISVGVNGPITGRGANVLLIDDYIKDIKEALSKTVRDSTWEWFQTTAFTRLEPGATVIIIATRWHWDDLIGRILRRNPGGKWQEIRLPALAEANDPLGRPLGAPLFPERYNIDALEERLEVLGTFFFNALFQQRPENENAKLTNRSWIEAVDILPPIQELEFIRVWDLAATPDGGDYTCGMLQAYHKRTDTIIICDVLRRQLSPGAVESLVYRTAVDDGEFTPIVIEQEPGSSGKSLINHYTNNVLTGWTVSAFPVGNEGGKVAKAQPFLGAAEAGRIKILKGHWNAKFMDEFADFPGGDYDDQVDVAAVGYMTLRGVQKLTASWGRADGASKTRSGVARKYASTTPEPTGASRAPDSYKSGAPGVRSSGVVWGRRSK